MMFARLHPIPQQPGTRLLNLAFCFALLPLLCYLPAAAAQNNSAQENAIKVEQGKDGVRLVTEQPLTVKTTIPQKEDLSCQAVLSVGFEQRNTVANVDGTIENTMCAASSGDYELGITFKDASGEQQTTTVIEQWQRSDDKTIKFASKYPIGENSDLTRVKVRKVHCTCTPIAPK